MATRFGPTAAQFDLLALTPLNRDYVRNAKVNSHTDFAFDHRLVLQAIIAGEAANLTAS